MDDIKSFFLGYGVIVSESGKMTKAPPSSSKAWIALRQAYCEEIITEIISSPAAARNDIAKILKAKDRIEKTTGKICVLIIPTIETLGDTAPQIEMNYDFLVHLMHVVVLNRPELSTYDRENDEVIISLDDFELRDALVKKSSSVKPNSWQGRKAKDLSADFRKTFWLYQNYVIDIENALEELSLSKPTFLKMTKDYMTAEHYRKMYKTEFDALLSDYRKKPVRGIKMDADIETIIIACSRRMGDDWDFTKVQGISQIQNVKMHYIPEDYLRFRLNYLTGRRQMFACAEEYKDDKDIIKRVNDYFANSENNK